VISTRAADAFEWALESTLDGARRGDPVASELLDVATALRRIGAQHAVAPSQEFTEQLRLRLMAEAEGLSAARAAAARTGVSAAEPAPVLTLLRGGKVVAGAVASLLVGGTAAAVVSSTALPGDVLYPVKRGVEELRLAAALSDAARGGTALALARERLDEAELLATADGAVAADRETTERVGASLDDFDARAFEGIELLHQDYADSGDPASLAEIDTFLSEALPRLERLRVEVPPELVSVVNGLIDRLGDSAVELDRTVASCGTLCTNLGIGEVGFDDTAMTGHRRPAEVPPASGGATSASGAVPGAALPGAALAGDAPVDAEAGGGTLATTPLPGVGASAGLPTVGVDDDGVSAGVQLPGLGLPGATADLPSIGAELPLGSSTTSTTPPADSDSDSTCVTVFLSLCVD
jgi:hypothetical protein